MYLTYFLIKKIFKLLKKSPPSFLQKFLIDCVKKKKRIQNLIISKLKAPFFLLQKKIINNLNQLTNHLIAFVFLRNQFGKLISFYLSAFIAY